MEKFLAEIHNNVQPGCFPLRDRELTLDFSALSSHRMLLVPTYHFCMVHSFTAEEMGQINLRAETNLTIERYAGHIGYAVHETHRGRHYAARAVKLLIPLARRLGISPLWITCDPANAASRRSCEIAGAELVEVIALPPEYAGYALGQRQKCRYRLDL